MQALAFIDTKHGEDNAQRKALLFCLSILHATALLSSNIDDGGINVWNMQVRHTRLPRPLVSPCLCRLAPPSTRECCENTSGSCAPPRAIVNQLFEYNQF